MESSSLGKDQKYFRCESFAQMLEYLHIQTRFYRNDSLNKILLFLSFIPSFYVYIEIILIYMCVCAHGRAHACVLKEMVVFS